jgi:hypothetical protein
MQKNNSSDQSIQSLDKKSIHIGLSQSRNRTSNNKKRKNFKDEKGESLLSKLSKSNSSMFIKKSKKRQKPLRWSEAETNSFYTCLELYGRDFDKIVWIFKHKRKRQLIRKFNKERKKNFEKVEKALKKHKPNIIYKHDDSKNDFFNSLFDKTDDSDESDSEGSVILDCKNYTDRDIIYNQSQFMNNNIIPENLEEEEFEKEIEILGNKNLQNKNDLNDSFTLKELLTDLHNDLKIPSMQYISSPKYSPDNKIEEEEQENDFFKLLDLEAQNPKYLEYQKLDYYLRDEKHDTT